MSNVLLEVQLMLCGMHEDEIRVVLRLPLEPKATAAQTSSPTRHQMLHDVGQRMHS